MSRGWILPRSGEKLATLPSSRRYSEIFSDIVRYRTPYSFSFFLFKDDELSNFKEIVFSCNECNYMNDKEKRKYISINILDF